MLPAAAANACCRRSPCVPILWSLQELEELYVELARDNMVSKVVWMLQQLGMVCA